MTTPSVHEDRATAGDPPPKPDTARRLLTIREAGQTLGVGRTTVYELISSGRLEVVHIGRSARIPVDAIDDFVRDLRARQAS